VSDFAARPDCVFCKIVAGDLPSRRIYADDEAVAFLDLGPWQRGHSLVVPRQHVDDLLTDPPMMARLGPAIDTTARLLASRLGADGLNLLSSARPVAGQEVFHLHVHLVPRYADRPGLANLVGPERGDDSDLDGLHRLLTG
jgi:histidine triad (HIT) family protein